MYEVYLGTMLCPVTPSKLTMKIKGQNKTMNLINDGEINILKQAGLTEVSFDLLLPNVQYRFANYKEGFENAKYFLGILEKLKVERKPFIFKVIRTFPNGKALYDTEDMKVSLEDYDIVEDAKEGFDVKVSVKLKQYRDYGTKLIKIIDEETASVEEKRSTENSPEPTSDQLYTVVTGDSLWNIAKKFYGDGSKWTAIFEANKDKIKNANLIYPGQVLKIPNVTDAKTITANASSSDGKKSSGSGGKKTDSGSKQTNTNTECKLTVNNSGEVFTSRGDVTISYYNTNKKYTRISGNNPTTTVTMAKGTKANVTIVPKSGYRFTALTTGTWSKVDKGSQGVVYTCAGDRSSCLINITWKKGLSI